MRYRIWDFPTGGFALKYPYRRFHSGKIVLGILCILCVSAVSLYAGTWPDFSNGGGGAWTNGYYRPISITNSTGAALIDYQVCITLTTAALGNPYTHIKADGSDIRFTQSDKQTEITNYWIDSWNNAGNSTIWLKVPNLPTGTTTIYMYYGNPSAISTSNSTNTFIFFEDFETYAVGSQINGQNGWSSTQAPANMLVANDTASHGSQSLRGYSPNDPTRPNAMKSFGPINYDVLLEYDVRTTKPTGSTYDWTQYIYMVSRGHRRSVYHVLAEP